MLCGELDQRTRSSVCISDIYVEIVRVLLQTPNIDLNKIDDDGDCALGVAREKNHYEIVQLLSLDADLAATTPATTLSSTGAPFQANNSGFGIEFIVNMKAKTHGKLKLFRNPIIGSYYST